MTIKRPVPSQMRAMADRFGMHLSDAELDEFREIMEPYIQAYDRIDAVPDNLPESAIRGRRGTARPPPRIRSTPGTTGRRCEGRRTGRCAASGSC